MLEPKILAQIGSLSTWSIFTLVAIWIIRTWPVWKQKINEARKIELDADGERLAQAFARIRVLEETQTADRRAFNDSLSEERRRCDQELDMIRKRLTASEDENRGLQAMIRQNSSSTAVMIGRPDAVAESTSHREKE